MKQLVIIFIFFVLMNINANGQRDQENTYYPSEYLNKFVGDWIWYSGSDTVRLQFKKVALNIPDVNNSYWENLIGCHKYVKKRGDY